MDRLFRKNYHRYFRIVSVAAYFFIMSLLLSGCYQEAEPAKHSQHIENVSISQNQPSQPEPKSPDLSCNGKCSRAPEIT